MDFLKDYIELAKEKKELKEQLKEVEERLKEELPKVLDFFDKNDVDKMTIGGHTIYPKKQIWASVPSGAIEDVKKAGYESLVKEKVNTQTMSSLIREMMKEMETENIEDLPDWTKGLSIYEKKYVGVK